MRGITRMLLKTTGGEASPLAVVHDVMSLSAGRRNAESCHAIPTSGCEDVPWSDSTWGS